MKTYVPRMFGTLGGLSILPDLTRITKSVDVGVLGHSYH